MNILEAAQGSPEWHAHRATHFNASDAPAMLGLSPYKTRSELLRELATGITPEIDAATQRRFDDGHRFEALARPLAEKILGEELFPVVGYDGKLSASFDGLTMDGDVCFEHKTLNAGYRDAIATGSELPEALLVQIEQQLFLSQAERCLFMASRWNDNDELIEEVHCMVEIDPNLRDKVLKGWEQFQHDLENYQHEEIKAAPVSATIESLPALMVQVEGKVLATNLDAFKQAAQTFIANIKTDLQTDQDFADADKMVKFLKDGEERLALAKDQALAQTASIDELFRTVDAISEQMRSKRLALDKLVKAEKENRRAEIVKNAQIEITGHVLKLNERIGGQWMPVANFAPFVEAVKGLKSLDSMRDKVATALANAKIEANEIADRIEANRKSLDHAGNSYIFLFPDFASVCTKPADDFAAIAEQRIRQHMDRMEAESIQKEEAERAKQNASNALKEAIKADVLQADQLGKTAEAMHAEPHATERPQAPAASTPPIQADEEMIADFIRLLPVSLAEKKAMRETIVKWETYRMKMTAARGLAVAA